MPKTNYENLAVLALLIILSIINSKCVIREIDIKCDMCLQQDPNNHFCYQKDYIGDKRCGIFSDLNQCEKRFLVNNSLSGVTIIKNEDFKDNFNEERTVQIKPQNISIKIREGDKVNFTFSYKPVKNYPLDLYYLMDLTISMKDDFLTIKSLGKDLGESLGQYTENYRVAFGSYIDKTMMPFYPMEPAHFSNPCSLDSEATTYQNCGTGYIFNHWHNFSEVTADNFMKEVTNEAITANLDNLEGGMEALLQVILCKERLDWAEYSRKLVILATGSTMHLAGDGLLAGAVEINHNKCLIDDKGKYNSTADRYDYPSIPQIHRKLKENKMNVIFAVKENVTEYYKEMEKLISDSAYVGILSEDSKNVIDLVKEGYMDVFRRVKFEATLNSSYVDVKFYANCDNTNFVETNECNNMESGKEVTFIAEITLTTLPDINSETFYIVEQNIHESIAVNVEYLGICTCDNDSQETPVLQCLNGVFRCGACNCHKGWSGEICDRDCENLVTSCRNVVDGIESVSCSGHGDCLCGLCSCDYGYSGPYCERRCPVINDKLCNGHGSCALNNTCVCEEGFSGEMCTCLSSTSNCDKFGTTCFGNGNCVCNKCVCKSKNYKGRLCERFIDSEKSINYLCKQYDNLVIDYVEKDLRETEFYDKVVQLGPVTSASDNFNCELEISNDTHQTYVSYKYETKGDFTKILVKIDAIERVSAASFSAYAALSFFGVLIAGIMTLLVWKTYTHVVDKREYARFEAAQKDSHFDMNPMYRNPIQEYVVPKFKNS